MRRTYPDDKRKRGWTHGRKEEKGNGRKATNERKAIKKSCIMQSGERAAFSPHFLPLLHKTG